MYLFLNFSESYFSQLQLKAFLELRNFYCTVVKHKIVKNANQCCIQNFIHTSRGCY